MKRLARILFGYRDDLNLSAKWWHRALLVLFIVVMVAATFLIWGSQSSSAPEFTLKNLTVLTNLEDYTYAHPEIANTAEELGAADAEQPSVQPRASTYFRNTGVMLAKRESTGELTPYGHDIFFRLFCNADIRNHLEELRQSVRFSPVARYEEVDQARAQDWIARVFPDGTQRACLALQRKGDTITFYPNAGPGDLEPSDVLLVKYSNTAMRLASIRNTIRNTFATTYTSIGIALVLLNIYYRGFIYIVCGGRQT